MSASASSTTYLLTGANRGIGKQTLTLLLSRPNSTVIAALRSSNPAITDSLFSLPKATGTNLITVKIDASVPSDPDTAAKELKTVHGITKIDVIIANAGMVTHFGPAVSTPLDEIRNHFEINTLAPLNLLQTFYPFLQASSNPKFIVISTSIASLGIMEKVPFPALAYGISKVAANYVIRKLHFENPGLTTLAVHPGWVKTEMGHFAATANGMKEDDVPVTAEESAKGVLEQVDKVTKENGSGGFVGWDGNALPW
jgi:norsolorinic acid ketoreductase